MVKEDKVAVAMTIAGETKEIAAKNVMKLASQQIHIQEQLLPSAQDIGIETKQVVDTAIKI